MIKRIRRSPFALFALLGAALLASCDNPAGGGTSAAAILPVSAAAPTGIAGQPLADSVSVVVHDARGRPVAGHTVTWTVTTGGGSVSPATSVTSAEGVARTRWTLGPAAGEQRLQAAASASMTTTFVASAQAGAPPVLGIVSGNGQTGMAGTALSQPLVVEVRQNGAPVPGVGVIWAAGAGMGSLSAASPVTDAQGRAQVTWTLGATPGAQTVSATVTGAGTVVFNATATPLVGPVISKVSGDGQTAQVGTAFEVVVEVRQDGAPVPGVTVAWSAAAGMGSVSPASSQTDAQGRARATWTLGSTPGAQSLSATAAGVGTVVFNATATAAPGPLVIIKVSGDGQTGSVRTELPGPIVLEVRRDGAPVRGVQVGLTSTGGGYSVYTPPLTTDPQGRVTTRWVLGDTVGVQTLTAHVAGADPVTFTATALGPGGSTQVLKVSGDGQTTLSGYRAPQNVVVRVVNAQGQGVPNVTVRWSGAAGEGATTDAGGYAVQVAVGPRQPGTGTVRATVLGLPPVDFSITSVAGPPNRILAWEDVLYILVGTSTLGRATYITQFDAAGLGGWLIEDRQTTEWTLLDNTGAVGIVYSGINSRYLRGLAVGEDRLEISRNGARDTVRVVVTASALRASPAVRGAARPARPAAVPSVGPASDRRRGRP